jgi:hypothetical protein
MIHTQAGQRLIHNPQILAHAGRARRTYVRVINGSPEPGHGRELTVTIERDSQRK